MKTPSLIVMLLTVPLAASAQSTIYYSQYHENQTMDLNQDGTVDFRLIHSLRITQDIPASGAGYSFSIRPAEGNYVLGSGSVARILTAGETVSLTPLAEAGWQSAPFGLGVASWNFNLLDEIWSGWHGPMAGLEEGFLGLRFASADGDHFGWARVRLTGSGFEATARILDYAFETRPGEAIIAGAVPEPKPVALLVGAGLALWLLAARKRASNQKAV
jgi:hypothetical protein